MPYRALSIMKTTTPSAQMDSIVRKVSASPNHSVTVIPVTSTNNAFPVTVKTAIAVPQGTAAQHQKIATMVVFVRHLPVMAVKSASTIFCPAVLSTMQKRRPVMAIFAVTVTAIAY